MTEEMYDYQTISVIRLCAMVLSDCPITAKPFFLSRGYRLVREQQMIRDEIVLTNVMMENSVDLSVSKKE